MADEETPLRSEDGATEAQATQEETVEATPAAEEVAVVEEPAVAEAKADKVEEKKEEPVAKAAPSGKFAALIKSIEELSVLELADLVKELEERFGVSASAPMGMMMAGPAGAGEQSADEGKSTYTVHLVDAGAQKIAVIKAVREIVPELGLKEAKDLVDGAPKDVKKDMPKADAETAKGKLEAAGAKVELK